jgi:8-oxo-dGTP pyrophosphatase MutT (NUDIX family)
VWYAYRVSTIREAASVILLREVASGFEVFLLRRHRSASFMASAYVFPGGATEPGEDAKTAAARELFEEAGVLLARDRGAQHETLQVGSQEQLRHRVLTGTSATAVLELAGLAWATEGLVPWAHWITPSVETKRFSARFFVGELPAGQIPKFDATETVDQVWVTPSDGLARAGELALPPPQVRTLWELAQHHSLDEVMAAAKQRAEEPHPIMPRLAPPAEGETGAMLLLPWDPDYTDRGTGEATPLGYQPAWAVGPSRFKFSDKEWKHFAAP